MRSAALANSGSLVTSSTTTGVAVATRLSMTTRGTVSIGLPLASVAHPAVAMISGSPSASRMTIMPSRMSKKQLSTFTTLASVCSRRVAPLRIFEIS